MPATPPSGPPFAWRGPTGLRRRFARWVDIRPGERLLIALIATGAFSVVCSYNFLKPVSKSIFLAEHGADRLGQVFVATAAFLSVVGLAYGRLSRTVPLVPLLNGVFVTLGLATWGFRVALDVVADRSLLAYGFYVFISSYGVLAVALVYLATNHLLEPRQARRLIGYVGAGAIIGGVVAGLSVSSLATRFGTDDMLWGGLFFLALAIASMDVALLRMRGPRKVHPARAYRAASTLRLIASHSYLRLLIGLIAIVMLCSSLVEYQFNWAIEQFVKEGDETTAYFGFWYAAISMIALPVQLFVTAPLLRRFGVGPALLLLPTFVFAGSIGMVLVPGLALGTGLKVADAGLRYSTNKSAVELLYLPLPLWLKDRTKVFMDTVLDRLAKGLAGVLLILFVSWGFGVREVAVVTVGLSLGWMVWALTLRRRYVDAFREALRRRTIDLAAERLPLHEPAAVAGLFDQLHRDSEEAQRQALDMLLEADTVDIRLIMERLIELAGSEDPGIAAEAMRVACRRPVPELLELAERRIDAEEVELGFASAAVLLASTPERGPEDFLATLEARGPRVEAHAAAALLAAGSDLPERLVGRLLVDRSAAGTRARLELAESISQGRLPHRRELLRRLMADPEPSVAISALRGAGQFRDPTLVPFLVAGLRRPGTRRSARAALAAMGQSVVRVLDAYFWDPRIEHAIRRRLPRAIAGIGTPSARRALVRGLGIDDPDLRHQVLSALGRVAREEGSVPVPRALLESELIAECHLLARLLTLLAEPSGTGPRRRLYERAIREAVSRARERTFRLLGLHGKAQDWENASLALSSGDNRLRESAVEFTDSSLPERLRRLVVPLIDDIAAAEALERVGRHLEVQVLTRVEAYDAAASGSDRWLAACALHAIAEERVVELRGVVHDRLEDDDPWVAQAARVAAEALA